MIRSLRQYILRLNIPDRICNLGISREEFDAVLDEMVESALNDTCTAGNPRVPTAEEVRELYITAYLGRQVNI